MPDVTPSPEVLDEDECLRLIAPGGVGRLAYTGRFGITVVPVNYWVYDGNVVFRTAVHSPTDDDLRTGIMGADYVVAFEVDEFNLDAHAGWSVLVRGSLHHVDAGEERDALLAVAVEPWAAGKREQFMRITPSYVTGRRVHKA